MFSMIIINVENQQDVCYYFFQKDKLSVWNVQEIAEISPIRLIVHEEDYGRFR